MRQPAKKKQAAPEQAQKHKRTRKAAKARKASAAAAEPRAMSPDFRIPEYAQSPDFNHPEHLQSPELWNPRRLDVSPLEPPAFTLYCLNRRYMRTACTC